MRYLPSVSDTSAEPSASPDTGAEDRVARARARRAAAADAEDLAPKLPRGKGFVLSKGHLIKIALTASVLVMLLVIQRPCANAVSIDNESREFRAESSRVPASSGRRRSISTSCPNTGP